MATHFTVGHEGAKTAAKSWSTTRDISRQARIRRAAKHSQLSCVIPTIPVTISLAGLIWENGYLVRIDGRNRRVAQAQFELLLEMALALYRFPKAPFVGWWHETYCYRTESSMRKSVERLREDLLKKKLVYNVPELGYCLAVDASRLECSRELFHLPSDRVTPKLLSDLDAAYNQAEAASHTRNLPSDGD